MQIDELYLIQDMIPYILTDFDKTAEKQKTNKHPTAKNAAFKNKTKKKKPVYDTSLRESHFLEQP